MVAIVGEPGVGKSRLVWEFTPLASRPRLARCSRPARVSYGKATPYLPVIELLAGYFEIEDRDDIRDDSREGDGQAAHRWTARWSQRCRRCSRCSTCPSRCRVGGGSTRPSAASGPWTPCKRLLLRESQAQPLLLVFEDLHWIDAETQALLDGLVESLPTARLLLLVNYRPEYRARLGRQDLLPPAPARPLAAGERRRSCSTRCSGEDASLEPLKRF